MHSINVDCFRDEYHIIAKLVRDRGIKRYPRGLKTRDLGFTTIVLRDPLQPVLPTKTGRKISKRVAAVETLQIIAGESRPDLLLAASPLFEKFMEHDSTGKPTHFHGAYGQRVGAQLDAALDKLQSDADSRQAIITLWDPIKDNTKHKRDYPCTVALGLAIVNDRLELKVLMRSNDIVLGTPYDCFVFQQLQWTLAHALDIAPGVYYHTAWSLHVYEDDIEKIDHFGPSTAPDEYQPRGLMCSTIETARKTASQLMDGNRFGIDELREGEDFDWLRWYADQVAPLVG